MRRLITKYDRPGPRYTSYPPVPFWKHPPTVTEWLSSVNESIAKDPRLDLYLHVPLCEELCYYCGCHRIITRDKERGSEYAELLMKEWELYREKISAPFTVNSVHFGGGTPTFLLPEDLEKILTSLNRDLDPRFIGAVEVDPRTCTNAHLNLLRSFGFKRISLGIQDFNDRVQNLINRKQSFTLVEGIVRKIRAAGFTSLNFDLIYGLPGQTKETVEETIRLVSCLDPDSIAYYSYAHLPARIPNQRLINESQLPSPEEKLGLYLTAQEELRRLGYVHVGMDHFAKPGSHLSGTVTRSFMGYTDEKSPLLIGLGASAISSSPGAFVQNEKVVREYGLSVTAGKLPITQGHALSAEEKEISRFMQDLFCQGEVTFPPRFGEALADEARIIELERDGLIVWKNRNNLIVTPLGKNFLRNIAMAIDPLLQDSAPVRFSQTI